MRRTLVLMVKEPRPGRVKTRLAAEIGTVPAAWWFRHQTARLIRRLRDPRWHLVLAVSPDRAGMRSRIWPADLTRVPQGSGDLGLRMTRQLRAAPAGPVCVIGGDIPGITPAHIARAFDVLGHRDAVFGPAADGGYWLIGMKRVRRCPPGLLRPVRWSSPHALADSLTTLNGLSVGLADTLQDVDTAADLAALAHDAGTAP